MSGLICYQCARSGPSNSLDDVSQPRRIATRATYQAHCERAEDASDRADGGRLAEFSRRAATCPVRAPPCAANARDTKNEPSHDNRLSEQSALKRIRAARAARDFPAIFVAVAENRLNLSAVVMLTPHLKPDTAEALIEAAMGKTLAELEVLLAHWHPKPDVPTTLTPIPAATSAEPELSLRTVGGKDLATSAAADVLELSSRRVASDPPAKLKPLAPEKHDLHMTIPQSTHDNCVSRRNSLGMKWPTRTSLACSIWRSMH